jgi:hypothetical protein
VTVLSEPIDELHQECILARNSIRQVVAGLRRAVAHWTPRPMPKDWRL